AVGVDDELAIEADHFADGADAGDVVVGLAADFDLDGGKAFGYEFSGSRASPRHIVSAEREPAGNGERPASAAEQVIDRFAGSFTEHVPGGHFDRAFGEPIVLDGG